jgi:N-acetylmuramoyl-L-alanine amidase
MKVAIVVGHDRVEQGAFSNLLKQSEFVYNSEVAKLIGFDTYFRNTNGGYSTKISELSKRINAKKYDLVIELHFNSFNAIANGCEALYFQGSVKGQRFAEMFTSKIVQEYGTINRVAKSREAKDRGGLFLKSINAPCIILEPFFGDNKEALLFKCHSKYAEIIKEIYK